MQTVIVILVLTIIALATLCLKLSQERKTAPKEPIVIEVCKCMNGTSYHAKFQNGEEYGDWAVGYSFYDAVGSLLHSNTERVNIKIEYLDDVSR